MSNNLNLDQVAEGQDSAEVTINDQSGQLDAAMTEVLSVPVDNTNAASLTAVQLRRNFMFDIVDGSPVPTATITLTVVGAIERGLFVVLNETAFDVDVEISGQSEPAATVAAGDASTLYSDGVNVRSVGGGGGGSFLPIDGSLPMTGNLEIAVAGIDIILDPTNATVSKLRTDSLFWQFDVDVDGTPSGFAVAAASLAPLTDDIMALGDASLQWNKLLVGTGTSVFKGHAEIDNQKELRLYELDANGANYSALRAAASMAGTVTYTLPSADGAAGAELSTNGSGTLSWVTPPYDIGGSFGGSPTASLVIFRFIAVRAISFPANFSGSHAEAQVASTGTATIDVQKNGVSIGTIVYTSSATATFTTAGGAAQSLAAGDQLTFVAPGSPDATLANLFFTLAGTRA